MGEENRLAKIVMSLNEEHLESFMLMAIERDVLLGLDNEVIIDKFASHSNELRRLLVMR